MEILLFWLLHVVSIRFDIEQTENWNEGTPAAIPLKIALWGDDINDNTHDSQMDHDHQCVRDHKDSKMNQNNHRGWEKKGKASGGKG